MIQVKVFTATFVEELEFKINEWIQRNRDVTVIDIKYQIATNSRSAMIIYDEPKAE